MADKQLWITAFRSRNVISNINWRSQQYDDRTGRVGPVPNLTMWMLHQILTTLYDSLLRTSRDLDNPFRTGEWKAEVAHYQVEDVPADKMNTTLDVTLDPETDVKLKIHARNSGPIIGVVFGEHDSCKITAVFYEDGFRPRFQHSDTVPGTGFRLFPSKTYEW